VVKRITVYPAEGSEAVEAVISDGTGEISVVWMGRRSIPGLRLGTRVVVEGVLAEGRGRRKMVNRGSSSGRTSLNETEMMPAPPISVLGVPPSTSPTMACRMAASASGDASATISSPRAITVSGCGITTCPSRRIATIAESGGSLSS
jgi:hypothetical protein